MLRRIALALLVLLVACGRPGGPVEVVGSRAQQITAPGTPPAPATLGWPSPAVIGSETTGTLPGEGSVGVAGDYRYTLPIEVPPGRAGMAPSLSLSYSSSGENGIAGVGWALTGLSAIKKCNNTVATDGYSLQGVANCLDGQRLVFQEAVTTIVTGANTETSIVEARTESDFFARIESISEKNSPPNWPGTFVTSSYKVYLRGGRIRSYAENPSTGGEFLLTKEEDRFGNLITYEYESATERRQTIWLDKISYTGRISSGELGSRWIKLKYEDREDQIFATDSSPVSSSRKRLKSIDCYAPAPDVGTSVGAPSLAWSYALEYSQSPASGRSILGSVKRTGPAGSALFAKEFDWDSTKGGVYNSQNFSLPQSDTAGDFLVLDVEHDGRDELLFSPPAPGSPALLHSTVGTGNPLVSTATISSLSNTSFLDASVGDIDGDGVPEIIAPDRTPSANGKKEYRIFKWLYALNTYEDSTPAIRPWKSYLDPASTNNTEQPIFLVDLDGDGLVDMIQAQYEPTAIGLDPSCVVATTPDRPRCLWYNWFYFHNDGGSFGSAQLVLASKPQILLPPRSGSPFSAAVRSDRAGRGHFAGVLAYAPSNGQTFAVSFEANAFGVVGLASDAVNGIDVSGCLHGNFSGRGNEEFLCEPLPADWRTTIFDFDGDGRDELFAYWGKTNNGKYDVLATNHIYVDVAGSRQEDSPQLTPLATGDFNGDGVHDAIFYDQALGQTFAALNAGNTRDLMVGVRNETAPKRMESVHYSQRWSADPVTAKPCNVHPVHCLRQGMNVVVERDVYRGSDVDTYEHSFFNYEDPREDVHGRGFLGFATVRAWNPDRLTETITEYDNAASVNGVYFAFMPSRVSQYTAIAPAANSPHQYTVRGSVVKSKYAIDTPSTSSYFRHPTTWDSTEWETNAAIDMTVGIAKHFVFSGPAPTPLRERNGESSFDNYGNQTYSRSETVGGVKTEVTATYDNNPTSWLIGELTQTLTTVTEPGAGTPTPRQVNYTYGSNGELKSSTIEKASSDAAIKYTTSFSYNSDGLVISTTGSQPAFLSPLPPGAPLPAGDADRSVYIEYDPDEGIFPRKVWNDLGHVARMLYHPAFGEISDEISVNGVETQVVYDGLGRARKVSSAGETPVSIHLGPRTNAGGKLIGSYVDTSGAGVGSTHTEYDEYGRGVLQSHVGFDGTSIFSKTSYDGLGRLLFSSRSGFGQPAATGTTYAYDGLNRVVGIIPPDANATTTIRYTFFETHIFNPHESYSVRDVDGRVVNSVGVGDSNVVSSVAFQYGNFSQIKSITDSKGNVSRIYYDQRGRRVNLSDPDAGVSTFHYNGFGDLTELDVPGINGSAVPAKTLYTRDALGRVAHVANADGATEFKWDTSPYGIGLLASQRSPQVAQTFEYDWYGRPSKETWTVDNESFDMLTSYDGSGRLSTVTYPDVPGRTRFTVQRNYSNTKYLANVTEIDSPTPVKFWEIQARNADDQLLQGQFGNGRLSKRVYEPTMGRLKSITDMACVGVNCVGADYSLGYTYLNDGNVDTRTDYVTSRAEKFGYDALNRLTSWELAYGGSTTKTAYDYDDIGNLIGVKVGGVPTEVNTPYPSGGVACAGAPGSPCPGPHALESATVGGVTQKFGYDTRGRQIKTPGRTVAFSEANLPTLIDTSAGSTAFSYDASGSRVKKAGPSEQTLTLGGLYERRVTQSGIQHVFFVSGGDGNMTQVGFTEGLPDSDRVEYLHTDILGSTGAVTDDTGAVTRSYYEPFGARIAAKGTALPGNLGDVRRGFTGHAADDDLALVNMKGRVYDPSQRRFISPDPLVSTPSNAQSYNRYSYVWNNPLNFTDPSGFEGAPPPSPPIKDPPPDNHTTGGGPGNPGGGGGNWTAYHTYGGSKAVQAVPFKGSPAQGENAGKSASASGSAPIVTLMDFLATCETCKAEHEKFIARIMPSPMARAGVTPAGPVLIVGAGVEAASSVAAVVRTTVAVLPTVTAAASTPQGQVVLHEVEEVGEIVGPRLGSGLMAHFTDAAGVTGITGVDVSTLTAGDKVVVQTVRFGQGVTSFLSERGRIFVTELLPNVTSGQLNQVGVFGAKQQFAIQFSRESAFFNNIRPVAESAARSIFSIPGGSTFVSSPGGAGPFDYLIVAR